MNVKELAQIEELFHAALALPPGERVAYLNQACGANSSLFSEVASLLDAHRDADALGACVSELAAHWANQAHHLMGQTIGRYQIHSLLGVGGMGEVFLAEDVQLHRRAALKILPERFTADAAHVRRFEQETRAVLALNHPNIVTLFDLGQTNGTYFMATEYVEGETLRVRLQRTGALSVREALEIALQVAAALTAAHRTGIIHRDIKPENVMIRRDGYVKVLDFGLAKVTEAAHLNDTDSDDQSSLTESGAVMGTARYMSPEQARGIRVDARTDQFSLAVVLYEMLAGRAPFAGETRGDLLVSILTAAPPPLVESAPATPAVVETILQKALAKEANARYASVTEFAEALKAVATELAFTSRDSQALPFVSVPTSHAASAPRAGSVWQWFAVGATLALLVWLVWHYRFDARRDFETNVLPQLRHTPVDSWKAGPESNNPLIGIAPDGKTIAFSKGAEGQTDIFIKQLNGGQTLNVTNDAWDDQSPVWSPDGQRLAYLSRRNSKYEIWLIPSLGGQGALLKVLDETPRWLTRWSRDGRRVFYEMGRNFYALDVHTREATRLTNLAPDFAGDAFALSADETRLAFSRLVDGVTQLFVSTLTGDGLTQVTHEGEANLYPLWLPDGERMLYSSKRNGVHQICVVWVKSGHSVQLTFGHENLMPWDLSNDGQRIFYVSSKDQASLYLYDLKTGIEKEWVAELLPCLFPAFAPDGQAVAFQRLDDSANFASTTLLAKEADAEGRQWQLATNGSDMRWSPTGEYLAFLRRGASGYGLWTVRRDGAEERLVVERDVVPGSFSMQTAYHWVQPRRYDWSPDGQRLVYIAKTGKARNVWSQPLAGGAAQQLSQNTEAEVDLSGPMFSPDGQQVIYLAQRKGDARQQVWLAAAGSNQMLYQAASAVRLLGWREHGQEFLLGVVETPNSNMPKTVQLVRLAPARKTASRWWQISAAYLKSFILSPDASQLAFISRQSGADEAERLTLANGRRYKFSPNAEPNLFLAGLAWSPRQALLCYTKQSNLTSIWMIEHFQ